MVQNSDGLVMVNIGSSSTQIGVVKMVDRLELVHSAGINYCGALGPSLALEGSLKPVLVKAYDEGGRNFIVRNAMDIPSINLKRRNNLTITPDEYIQIRIEINIW